VTTVTKSDATALPSQITYTSGRSINVLETDQFDRAQSYTMKVTVQDPLTSMTNADLTFTVNI